MRSVPTNARHVLYDLLYSAIIEIRASSGRTMSDADSERVFNLSYLIHDWPLDLRDAESDSDHDALLRKFWQKRHRPSDPWLSERLRFFGVDPDTLG
jgi:hypothetical protein